MKDLNLDLDTLRKMCKKGEEAEKVKLATQIVEQVLDPTNPYFQHDCIKCVFLGGVILNTPLGENRRFDIYICPSSQTHKLDSILARFGNEGPEYLSYNPDTLHSDRINYTGLPDNELWGNGELEFLMGQRYEFWLGNEEYFKQSQKKRDEKYLKQLKKKQFEAVRDSEKG